jgi:hypothetical protein
MFEKRLYNAFEKDIVARSVLSFEPIRARNRTAPNSEDERKWRRISGPLDGRSFSMLPNL